MPVDKRSKDPVIRGVRYFLAHTPGIVRHGSKPSRDLLAEPGLSLALAAHLRSYQEAAAYPPHRAFLGDIYPPDLSQYSRPWFSALGDASRWRSHGELMPEEEFYGLMKMCDAFDLLWLEEGFAREVARALAKHPLVTETDVQPVQEGHPYSHIEARTSDSAEALPLALRDGRIIGCISRAHEQDASLAPEVLLENLACKASAAMALRTLLDQTGTRAESVDYVINCGEEAVGERYQRGGGNLAKAVAEMAGCISATGADVKAFCCGPVHALVMASALVHAGLYDRVAVVAGCSLAKLGMKFRSHLDHDQPVLEDVLAGTAILVEADDGISPKIRLDSVGRHTVGSGSSQQAIYECLVSEPLERLGLSFQDVDKYATELHNPEVTEPGGSGNVPLLNYRLIAALATLKEEISREDIPYFVENHGMPGFAPTQGHIASAIPFLGHALDRMSAGKMQRAMFLAKGSLFLGRMTQLSDGMSFMLEKNQ
jgi:hypothetical protein